MYPHKKDKNPEGATPGWQEPFFYRFDSRMIPDITAAPGMLSLSPPYWRCIERMPVTGSGRSIHWIAGVLAIVITAECIMALRLRI